ncbi:MAG: hypothetical protein AB9869_09925 [Verrucomicrobiia bacterium]
MKTITLLVVLVAALFGTNLSGAETDDAIIQDLQGKWVAEDNNSTTSMTITGRQFEEVTHDKVGAKGEVLHVKGTIEVSKQKGVLILTERVNHLSVYGNQEAVGSEDILAYPFVIKQERLYFAIGFAEGLSSKVPRPTLVVYERAKTSR